MKKLIAPEPPTNRIYDGHTFLDNNDHEHVIDFDEDDLWDNTKKLKVRDLDKTVKSEWSVSNRMAATLRKETEGLKYDPIPFKADKPKVKKVKCPVCGRNFTLKNGKFPQHGERGFYRYLDGTNKKDCKGTGQKFVPNPTQLKSYVFEGEIYNVGDKVLIHVESHGLLKIFFGGVGFFELIVDKITTADGETKFHFKNTRNGNGIKVDRLTKNIVKVTC
jgi:hypothetical protein